MRRHLLLPLVAVLPCHVSIAAEISQPMRMDEVIVTAPMMEEPLTIVTDPKAPRQPVPAHDGADYLKSIPGFSVIRKGGTDGDPVFRGMAGSRLNVLMDGEYILGGCGMRMDPPTAYVFPESYDSITVLKGPQTVLYGGGNTAGTALFERKPVYFETAATRSRGSLMFGSFGRNDQMATATAGAQQGYLQATGTRSDANDYEDGDGRKVHSAYTRWSFNATAGWTPDKDTRMELSVDRSDGKAAYADRSMDGTAFDRTGYGVKFEKRAISPLVEKIEAQVYHNYVDHIMDNYSLRQMPAANNYTLNNPDRATDGARLSAKLALTGNTQASIGLDYEKNKHTLRQWMGMGGMASGITAPIDVNSKPRTPDMTFENTGVFGEISHDLNRQDRLIGGLRFDSLDVQNEKTSGSGALSSTSNHTYGAFARYEHDLAEMPMTTYLGLGHAERPADWWERSTYNNFYLNPEKNTQLDAGMIYNTGKLRASVSAFYAQINDFILTRNNSTARNIDAATYGGEAELAYALSGHWSASAALAYVHGDNNTDNVPLAQMPPLDARLGLTYDDKTYSAGFLLRAAAEQDRVHAGYGTIVGQDIGRTPGFSVFSLNAGYRPKKGMLIAAGIDNLFDKTYAEHISRAGAAISGFTQTTRINEPGRNIWLKLNIAME